jgi:hypothetical protein
MKFLKAFLPVIAIIIFEYMTDLEAYIVHRNFLLMMLVYIGTLLIMIVFYWIYTKKSVVRNIVLVVLILTVLPYVLFAVLNWFNQMNGYEYNDLIESIYVNSYLIFSNYNLVLIGKFILLGSFVYYGIKNHSITAVVLTVLAIGIYSYLQYGYSYPLTSDPYEEFVFAFKYQQYTSLTYASTNILLMLSPVFLGFLSLGYQKKK